VEGAKKSYLFVIALLSTIFSLFAVTLPWFAAYVMVCIPLLIVRLWNYKKRLIIYSLLLSILVFIYNLYWIVHLPSTSLFNQGQSQGLVSESFRETNSTGIISTAQINEIFFPLLNVFHFKIQSNFSWPYLVIFNNWYTKIIPMNIFFFIFICVPGILITKKDRWRKYYLAAVVSFLVGIYFFTLNLGSLGGINPGINFFVWLNNNIPLFVIFRNMYDKFSPSYGFVYALLFGISLAVIIQKINSIKYKNLLILLSLVLILINAKPFILGEFDKLPHWTTTNYYQKLTNLNSDYMSAMQFFKSLPKDKKILTLPLAYGNVTVIKDEGTDNNYYFGVSPVYLLSGLNDYPGLMSFGDSQGKIRQLFFDKDYVQLSHELAKFDIDYVFVLNFVPEEIQRSYIYNPELYDLQSDEFKNEVLGEKVASFGDLYTLYKFKNNYEK
jgi:hypothetical protein